MRSLPRLPRRREQTRPRWQRISIGTARFAGIKALQGVAGLALGFTAIAVADTVHSATWRPVIRVAFILATAGTCAFVMWARTRGNSRRRNPSSISQAHNLWNRALNRRFRRG